MQPHCPPHDSHRALPLVALAFGAAEARRCGIADFIRSFAGDRVLLAEPGPEVDEAAAITAEGPVRKGFRPDDLALAGGAGDVQAQEVSTKGTSSVHWTAREPRPFHSRKRTLER